LPQEVPRSLEQAASQWNALLAGLSLRQKMLLAGGAIAVAAALWGFTTLLSRPRYVTLYSGLAATDAQSLGSRLGAKGISFEVSADGSSLLVPQEQLANARLETAAQGLPRNARLGFELFDTPNWTGSDFTERVNYQRALEGELERTLQGLSEVETARVHLVLPHESLYTSQEQPAKAAVILKTRTGRLSEQAQRAIPELVASAVEGLTPARVTVMEADTNAPLLHPSGQPDSAAYNFDSELAKTVLHTLEPVVGEGHVRASVHVEYDLSTSDNTEEVYDPKAAATLTQQKSEETAGGGGPAGIAGTASNLPPGTGAASPAYPPENQSSRSESATFAVSKSVRHTVQPAGRVRRIAAAVLIDDATAIAADGKPAGRRKRSDEEMKQFGQLVAAAIGLDTQRGDLLSVENLSFEQPPVLPGPAPPTKLERVRRSLLEWSSLLRYGAIVLLFLIVYGLIFRPVKKEILTAFKALPARLSRPVRELGQTEPALVMAGGGQGVEIQLPEGADEARKASALKKHLSDKIKAEPAAASRQVQSWIREDHAK
jgi:flagellar M-ring protein FliF